jgi:hypothetical protein
MLGKARVRLVYFDSNVYDHIAQTDATSAVKNVLAQARCHLFVSDSNLTEALRISAIDERARRVTTITTLCDRRSRFSWPHLEVTEILAEIRRCSPKWLNPNPDLRLIREVTDNLRKTFRRVEKDPTYLNNRHSLWSEETYTLIGKMKTSQKELKAQDQPGARFTDTPLPAELAHLQPQYDALTEPERYWRVRAAMAILTLLHEGKYDPWLKYLTPHLKGEIDALEWLSLWLFAFQADALPRIRVRALTDLYQLKRQITFGNVGDQTHAVHLLDVDVFFTADRVFASVLGDVEREVDRGAQIVQLSTQGDVVEQVVAAVRQDER